MTASTRPLVCLDLDGCLVDSREAITTCMNRALEDLGEPARPVDELAAFIGPPLKEAAGWLFGDGRPERAAAFMAAYRSHYRDTSLALTRAVDGMDETLDRLAADATLVVVTSKPRVYAVPIVEAVGLGRHLRFVEGPDTDAADEAKSETLRRAISRAGGPETVVMVGDRRFDIEAGADRGARTIGVTWGIGSADELRRAGADELVERPPDLPASVRRLIVPSPGSAADERRLGSPRRRR